MSKSINRKIDPEWMDLAWKQASLTLRHEEIIERIVSDAYSELSLTATNQSKRLYTKSKESKRIYLERMHLFQRLVFLKSEPAEKDQEIFAPESISEGDMIIRLLALIVRKSMRRNSFYGVTGMLRFICNYQFKDVRTIYDGMADKNGYKGEEDFRKNKQSVHKMITERFPDNLRVEETQNGKAKHFIRRKDQNNASLIRLVKESLEAFKPWRTQCLSAGFAPDDEERNVFRQEDGYDLLELKRLHILIHLDCLSIFTKAYDLAAPDTRLGIPQFFFGNRALSDGDFEPPSRRSGNSGNGGTGRSAKEQMLEEVRKRLARQDERLGKFIPQGKVIVRIDGREAASFDLDLASSVQFTVEDEDAERMEIIAEREQLVLAVHLLDDDVWQSQNGACLYEVRHENGMKVIFAFRHMTNQVSQQNYLSVTVAYKETSLRRHLSLWARRLKIRVSSWKSVPELSPQMQLATDVNSQSSKPFEERAPTWASALARYYSNNRLLRTTLVTLLLVLAFSTYTAVFTRMKPETNLQLEFWGRK